MSRFMFIQCQLSHIHFPRWARKWVNIRKAYCNFYQFRRAKLATMLENLGMCFEGHQHSGIDDARNISRVVCRMLEDGSELRINERIFEEKLRLVQELANSSESEARASGCNGLVHGDVLPVTGSERNSDLESEEESAEEDATETHTDVNGVLGACGDVPHNLSNLQHDMAQLHLTDPQTSNCKISVVVPDEDGDDGDDDVDDLLAYYALQKS